MKTPITVAQLAELDDQAFAMHVRQYPQGWQWEHAEAFRYAATRIARKQGLRWFE